MPLNIPSIDNRTYRQLLDEALARIPVHTPEWTNFNESDPGITLIEVFAFMAESLLYRANQIPERNRAKFLKLLGVPLAPASPARALVAFANDSGPTETVSLPAELELRAGTVPFLTDRALDVLPLEARAYIKRELATEDQQVKDYYRLLYASYHGDEAPTDLKLYETTLLDASGRQGVDLNVDTVDGSLWIALLLRAADKPAGNGLEDWAQLRDRVREQLTAKTLNLGLVPLLDGQTRRLGPVGSGAVEMGVGLLSFELPSLPPDGRLPDDPARRVAAWKPLVARELQDVLAAPGVVELSLPASIEELGLWTNLDPLEPGVGDFPPDLDDTGLAQRVLTWIRVRPSSAAQARFLWAGINASMATQRVRVFNERLEPGSGTPDQVRKLVRGSVVPGSVSLLAIHQGSRETWKETDDLLAASGEIGRRDATGTEAESAASAVFVLDAEAGELRFGDGLRGKRPPAGAELYASYDACEGAAGNVAARAIKVGPELPPGFSVSNPVPAWLGADGETVSAGERQVARYVQHRDRLVSTADFELIARRCPGIDLGRIEVLPAFHPDLSPNEPGDAPGAVTLMVIPARDPKQPDAPQPDRLFLDALCRHLDSRRLVTTELILRGPVYRGVWVSVGFEVMGGYAPAEVREAVKQRLAEYLAPLRRRPDLAAGFEPGMQDGWPLRRPVTQRQLMAEASRTPGVLQVNDLLLAREDGVAVAELRMRALELPRLAGISVLVGEPLSLVALLGTAAAAPAGEAGGITRPVVPVPFIPEEC